MTDIVIPNDGNAAFVYLTVAGYAAADYLNTHATFTAGTINKSNQDMDMGIFYAHPIIKRTDDATYPTDTHTPCFILRLYPPDIAALVTATGYTLTLINASGTKVYTGTIQGGGNITTYSASTSASASIVITDAPVATTLTMVLPATGSTGVAFNITGKLTRNDTSAGVAGMTVQLMQYTSGAWSAVSGKTATTAADGSYTISLSESPAGTYQFETTFAGGSA